MYVSEVELNSNFSFIKYKIYLDKINEILQHVLLKFYCHASCFNNL